MYAGPHYPFSIALTTLLNNKIETNMLSKSFSVQLTQEIEHIMPREGEDDPETRVFLGQLLGTSCK